MQNLLTRMTGPVLVFGLFFMISCSTLSKTESDTLPASSEGPLKEIEIINRQIEQDGSTPSLLLRKTELFIEAAEDDPNPSLRKPYYRNAYNTTREGISQFSESETEFSRVLTEAWSSEHNNGVRLLQERSENSNTDGTFRRAIDHLENAIIIQPDSLSSYRVLATAFYSGGLYADAEVTLNKLLEMSSDPDLNASVKEKLAFIYLESGDTGEAVALYEDLRQQNSSSITVLHGLINAYILDNKPEQAARELQRLTEEYSDRSTYSESLASVKYQLFELGANSLLSGDISTDSIEAEVENLISLLDDINGIYENLSDNSLMDEESTYMAAGYHSNGAAYLEDIRSNTDMPDSVTQMMLDTETEFLNTSLSYWEQLIEMNPDNIEYLYTLYTVYNRLEMFEEAESLEQSYNF
jgi:tetratricopeptide (TPR) repeat protein